MSDYDDESSSTEQELELLNEKLAELEALAIESVPRNEPTTNIEIPTKSQDESSIASDSSQENDGDSQRNTMTCAGLKDFAEVERKEHKILSRENSDTSSLFIDNGLEPKAHNLTTKDSSKARNPYTHHRGTQEVPSVSMSPKPSLPVAAATQDMKRASSSASSYSSGVSYSDDSSYSDDNRLAQDIAIAQTSDETHDSPRSKAKRGSPTKGFQPPKAEASIWQARDAERDLTSLDTVDLDSESPLFQPDCSSIKEKDESPHFANSRNRTPPRAILPIPSDVDRNRSPSTKAHDDGDTIAIAKQAKSSVICRVNTFKSIQNSSISPEGTILSLPASPASSIRDESLPTCDQTPEIHFSLYAPPEHKTRKPPLLHKFNQTNRPKASRRQVPVSHLFQAPASTLWKGRFEKFNALQSELANQLCHSDDHSIVSAPTGAGKTVIFEMAMARFITVDLQHCGKQRMSKNRKMVYIAPSRALCEERYQDWTTRLKALNVGIEVRMITGDADDPSACYLNLSSAHLILTTPEKWDSISRKWTENFFLLASVKLVMIDEVHLLGDETRGHSLEAIITRSKSIQRAARNVNATQGQIDVSR